MDIYTDDGQECPLYAVIDTPGSGNVVRIVNTATVEFPLVAAVEAFIVDGDIVEKSTTLGANYHQIQGKQIYRLKSDFHLFYQFSA